MNHRIGYACMNLDTSPRSYRTCRAGNLTPDLHRELIEHNLDVLEAMTDYNIGHGIRMYRVSSSLIPFASADLPIADWQREFRDRFRRIGEKNRAHGIRLSVHPGQYTLLNSPREEVVRASTSELEYHADLLELLGTDASAKMILHVGGVYGDKASAIRRFEENYGKLSDRIKKHLVIENDDKMYTVEDVLNISEKTGAPVVFDNLHHRVNPSLPGESERDLLEKIVKTWKERPKMHYSQQAEGKPVGAHSATIDLRKFREDFEAAYAHFDLDIMFEVKDKNRSTKKADLLLRPTARKFQEEWARYKYLIMSRSYADYSEIRTLFRSEPDAVTFYEAIDRSLEREPTVESLRNAFQHVWGYFKDRADAKEKSRFFKKLDKLTDDRKTANAVGRELLALAEKYREEYLLESYFLSEYRK